MTRAPAPTAPQDAGAMGDVYVPVASATSWGRGGGAGAGSGGALAAEPAGEAGAAVAEEGDGGLSSAYRARVQRVSQARAGGGSPPPPTHTPPAPPFRTPTFASTIKFCGRHRFALATIIFAGASFVCLSTSRRPPVEA